MFKTIETQEQYDKLSQLSMSQVGLKKDMTELQKMLLDYRRKNKIYELGDSIVIDGKYDKTFMPVLKIVLEDEKYFYCDFGQVKKGNDIFKWRHATDDEIELGRRI